MKNRIDLVAIIIAYASFVVLGMTGSMLGAVWDPHVYTTFNLTLDAQGWLLLTASISYFVGSYITGRLFARFKIGPLLAGSVLIAALGFIGYVITPSWWLMVMLGFVTGFGGGVLDGGMNIYFAAHFGAGLMNWLHASFGVGLIGSLIVTDVVFRNGGSWRVGYMVVAVLYLVVALLFLLTRSRWVAIPASSTTSNSGTPAMHTLRLPIVWLGIVIFALYAGLESGTGSWANSLFLSRGTSAEQSRLWLMFYWGSFTAGRIVFGFVVRWLTNSTITRLCCFGAIIGMAMLFWNPSNDISALGIGIFGFFFGPIFALMVTSTQERLGSVHAPNAIGFQVAAASVGVGILPGVAGVLATRFGLEIVPLILLVSMVIMWVCYELTLRRWFTPSAVQLSSAS